VTFPGPDITSGYYAFHPVGGSSKDYRLRRETSSDSAM
jgi:hypothetical protein